MAFNHWVEGSSPSRITIYFNKLGNQNGCPFLIWVSAECQISNYALYCLKTDPFWDDFSNSRRLRQTNMKPTLLAFIFALLFIPCFSQEKQSEQFSASNLELRIIDVDKRNETLEVEISLKTRFLKVLWLSCQLSMIVSKRTIFLGLMKSIRHAELGTCRVCLNIRLNAFWN